MLEPPPNTGSKTDLPPSRALPNSRRSLAKRRRAEGNGRVEVTSAAAEDAVSWEDALADFLRQMHSGSEKSTQKYYRTQITQLVHWATAQGITLYAFRIRHMREYMAFRADSGIGERSRRHDAVTARAFCRFCAAEGHMKTNPLAEYAVPRAEEAYLKCPSETEVACLLAATQSRWSAAKNPNISRVPPKTRTFLARRNYALFALCVDTGCRIGEVLALTLTDYDAAERVITIRKAKGNRPRTLPVSPALQKAVDAWLRVRPACGTDFLFISRFGGQLDAAKFGDQLQASRLYARETYEAECKAQGRPADDAFLSHFTLHGLRRYAATQLSAQGYDATMKMLGHSSVVTTQHYIRNTAETLRAAHAAAGPLEKALAKNLLVGKRSHEKKKRLL